MRAYERFLRYVAYDTASDPACADCPSTARQRVLAEALARASAPFYKGRESGPEHLGLGLNICDILCRRHGGALTVSNAAGGAQITARFENTRGTG